MVKRHLYQCRHPIDAYPFEAFSHGSWRIIEQFKIRDGNILTHFGSPELETNDNVPPETVRLCSRKATLSDCTCFLRPGIDICVLSTLSSTPFSSQESIEPVLIDAKISSIKRKSHGSRCTCQFYISFYRTQDPLGLGKRTLSKEISMVEIENIFILQQLVRKPCEDVYYRWDSSKDCPSKQEAKLFRGHFSSDVSWLLVTSSWAQIEFCVRSVQNKIIYEILDSESEKSVKTMNFHINDGVLRPNIKDFVSIVQSIPVGIFEVGPVQCDQEDDFLSFYDLMDLRRSKRRNVQPDRFLGFDDVSEAMPSEMGNRNRPREERSSFGISNQDGEGRSVHTHCSRKHTGSEEMVHDNRDDSCSCKMNSREVKSIGKKVKTTSAYKRRRKDKGSFGEAPLSIDVSEPKMKPAKPSFRNHAVQKETWKEISSNHGHRNIVPGLEKNIIWEGRDSRKKCQRRHSSCLSRQRSCEAKPRQRKFMKASEYKQLIERCMKNIDVEIKKQQQPLDVSQWEEIETTEPLNQMRDPNWSILVSDQTESSELEFLWKEMELSMATVHFLESGQDSSIEFSDAVIKESSKGIERSCQHEYKLDEEIGIICQLCSFVSTEIRDVLPPFLQSTCWITNKDLIDEKESGWELAEYGNVDFFCNPPCSDVILSEGNDNVWALIPDFKKKLHFHQKRAFEFLWRNIAGSFEPGLMEPACKKTGGCVISHAPGAGKTLLIIAFLVSYLKMFPTNRPLVLAPKTTLYTWSKEFKKWEITVPVYQIHCCRNFKKEIHNQTVGSSLGDLKPNQDVMHVMDCLEKIQKWHAHPSILLMGYTSFLALMREDSKLNHRKFMGRILQQSPGILILDEGHNPRSTRSRLRKALMKVKTELRILLSGTLFQNNFGEYFNTLCLARPKFILEVLRKLDPKVNGNQKSAKNIDNSTEKRARYIFMEKIGKKINSSEVQVRTQGLHMLRDMTNAFIDVYEGGNSEKLPGFQSYTILMKPTMIQQRILSKLHALMNNVSYKGYPLDLELLITLGSVHPWLIKTVASVGKYFDTDELEELEKQRDDVRKGSKVRFVVSLIHSCIIKGEKVLIFCRNLAPIDLFLEIFERIFGWRKGEEMLVLQGYQELCERGRVIDKFEERGGVARVLLASITACAEGISLTAASRVVLLDSEWNPSKTKQAIARAYRPGQERIVYVYQLLTCGTVEEEKFGRTTWKEWVSSMIFREALAEDPSCMQAENIGDDVLRGIVEDDQAKSFHMILKNEKVPN